MQVEVRPHPRGEAGTRISLEEAAKRAAQGRLDPRTRAWAIERIVRAGDPKGVIDRARILLDALRNERIYIEDPTDSDFMPSAACTLVGCHGLTFLGEDCDGLLIAWLAACGSIGIFGAVVGHGYNLKDGQLSHVLGAVWDGTSRWYKADPSTKQPFGTVSEPARERWICVHDGRVLCDQKHGCDATKVESPMSKMRPYSEFVGVVGGPSTSTGTVGEPPPEQVQFIPGTTENMPEMLGTIATAQVELKDALHQSALEHEKLIVLREYFNKPIVDMDIVQAGYLGDTSISPDDIWSQTEEDNFRKLFRAASLTAKYGDEAVTGKRPVARRTDTNEIVILGQKGEEFVQQQGNDLITGVLNIAPPSQAGQLGLNPYVIAAIVIAGVATWLLVGYGVYSLAHEGLGTYKQHLQTVQLKEYADLYNKRRSAGDTHEQAQAAVNTVSDAVAKQAKINIEAEEKSPMNKLFGTLETLMWGVFGIGLVVAGGYALINVVPLLKVKKTVEA